VVVGCVFAQVSPPFSVVGVGLIVAGGCLHWLSKAYLEQNRELTTAGPYRFTRNPFYLANLLIDVGIALVIGDVWIALVYFPLWALAYSATIREEEAQLRDLFGASFDEYAAAVPRFFPTLRPLPAERAKGRLDLASPNLAAGREYARLVGIALAPATLWAASALRRLGLDVLDGAHRLELAAILLVPVVWILKLAIAETFKRPEVRLVPFPAPSRMRMICGIAVSAPLLLIVIVGEPREAAVAAAAMATLAAAATSALAPMRAVRIAGDGLGIVAVMILGALAHASWLALLPALWFALCGLDEAGQIRMAPDPDPDRRAPPSWRYFRRVAAGAVVSAAVVGAAIHWFA
jgi:hypothetical protein